MRVLRFVDSKEEFCMCANNYLILLGGEMECVSRSKGTKIRR